MMEMMSVAYGMAARGDDHSGMNTRGDEYSLCEGFLKVMSTAYYMDPGDCEYCIWDVC